MAFTLAFSFNTLSVFNDFPESRSFMDRNQLPRASVSQEDTQEVDPSLWVDEYGDYLYRFAISRLRNADAAEEVVQDAFVAGLNNLEQFAGRGSERAWLLGILKKKIIDVFRKRQRDPINVDEESGDISQMLFDQFGFWRKEVKSAIRQSLGSLDKEEFWAILHRCLGHLPQRQADVFVLRSMNDQSPAEICKELEITSSNYWVILHRARLQLSSCMNQSWFQEGGE